MLGNIAKWRRILVVVGLAFVGVCGAYGWARMHPTVPPVPEGLALEELAASDFATYFEQRRQRDLREKVRPGNGERWLRHGSGQLVFIYLHGFGSSPVSGEFVVRRLAKRFGAQAYFPRLPGHGTNMEDMVGRTYADYVRAAVEALHRAGPLGERRVLIGSSMGGLLATYLAARFPDKVDGVILFSPFYDFVGLAQLLNGPGGLTLAEWLEGRVRTAKGPGEGPPFHPDFPRYAYMKQYTASLRQLVDLKRLVARPEVFEQVRAPVMLLYYPEDDVASVPAMREAFAQFTHHPASRMVPIHDGHHILPSEFVYTDKETILSTTSDFLSKMQAPDVSSQR